MSAPAESNVMRGAVRAVRGAGPMEAHFALTEVREGRYETPVLLACVAEAGGGCRLGAKVGAARGATAYEALARAQMFAASLDLADALQALLDDVSSLSDEARAEFGGSDDASVKRAVALLAKLPGGYQISPNSNDPTKNAGSRLDLASGGESEVTRG